MLRKTKKQLKEYLQQINMAEGCPFSLLEVYRLYFLKEKVVYLTLNQFQQESNLFVGFFWSPLVKHKLMEEIYKYQDRSYGQVSRINIEQIEFKVLKPPTYFKINEFTAPFQEIVNTYAIPLYKEINPMYFTCATFPFLFGIMFGDLGHGAVVSVLSAFMCLFYTPIYNAVPSLRGILSARYTLLLMGLSAAYCGFMYNDMMALPVEFFDSCYDPKTGHRLNSDCVYPAGVDPIWYRSKNELQFMNSLKMKLAVILGVMQMTMGVILKACNAIYHRDTWEFVHEFIPQILFFLCLMGYMDTLILIKWNTDYGAKTYEAPSIISTMI
jgi:V-type H+-transporting ATPase subunit a